MGSWRKVGAFLGLVPDEGRRDEFGEEYHDGGRLPATTTHAGTRSVRVRRRRATTGDARAARTSAVRRRRARCPPTYDETDDPGRAGGADPPGPPARSGVGRRDPPVTVKLTGFAEATGDRREVPRGQAGDPGHDRDGRRRRPPAGRFRGRARRSPCAGRSTRSPTRSSCCCRRTPTSADMATRAARRPAAPADSPPRAARPRPTPARTSVLTRRNTPFDGASSAAIPAFAGDGRPGREAADAEPLSVSSAPSGKSGAVNILWQVVYLLLWLFRWRCSAGSSSSSSGCSPVPGGRPVRRPSPWRCCTPARTRRSSCSGGSSRPSGSAG